MLSVSYFSHFQNRKRGPVPRLYKILRKYHVIIASRTSLRSPPSNLPQLLEFVTTMSNQCSQHFSFFLEFRVGFRKKVFYPSTGTMRIFNNGTWKDLCVANWDVVERNLVCQAQGYNGPSQGAHSKTGTSSLGNTTYSCEQLTQNCEQKNTEINCSGIKTFLSPQGKSLVMRMSIDTSTIKAELILSLKISHLAHS